MLGWMRKQTRSWFVYIAFGIIIVVFIFLYGFPQEGQRGAAFVAKVNDQKITRRQYDDLFENMLMFSRNIYKRSLTEKEITELRQRALDSLLEQALVIQEAARLGIEVSPEEVRREIARTPLFQSEGLFNRELYLRQLSARRMAPGEYERAVGTEMLVSKLVGALQNTTKLSHKELYERYRLENEKVSLRFLKLDPSNFLDEAEVSKEEVVAHYEKTRENYRVPERVKVRYLSFEPEQYERKVEIAPEEIEDFYRTHEDRFVRENKIKARHILIKVEEGAGVQAEEVARKKAEDARKKIEGGEDFSQLAMKLSQDTATASAGGDLGYFARGQMVKGFDDEAFSLKPGEVSPVVRTPLGFHLIKVEDVQEEGVEPLEKVRNVIEEELRAEKAEARSREEASIAIGQIYRSKDMTGYAKEHGLDVRETGFFSRGEPTREFGINESFNEAAFLLKEGEIAPIIRLGEKYLIMQLVEREESRVPDLKEVAAEVKRALNEKKAKKAAQEEAARLLSELASGASMDQIAKNERVILEETGLFTRGSAYIQKIGTSEELLGEAFSLTPEKPLPEKAYSIKESYYLVQLKERVGADREKFEAEKEGLRKRLLAQKGEERIRCWIKNLKEKATIEIAPTI